MGLDMYAYAATRAGQDREFSDGAQFDPKIADFVNPAVTKPREIAYWRKHPGLHGWFQQEWLDQGNEGDFNGDELEITWNMLDRLEQAVREGRLPVTQGFFFGNPADDYYREQDLEFIRKARAELFLGLRVFYNSSW